VAQDVVFLKALADDTRFSIVEFLLDGEKCVCEITPHVKRAQPTVSLQLKRLEEAGIIASRRAGRKMLYSIKDKRVCDVFKALGHKKGWILKKACCKGGLKSKE